MTTILGDNKVKLARNLKCSARYNFLKVTSGKLYDGRNINVNAWPKNFRAGVDATLFCQTLGSQSRCLKVLTLYQLTIPSDTYLTLTVALLMLQPAGRVTYQR